MKTIVVIPAYNEERSVGAVIRQIKGNNNVTQCVVVDDCSADSTAAVAKKSGAYVIHRHHNGGTGKAIKTGLQYAVNHKADRVILMDADGQHDPKYLPILMKTASGSVDYIIASRYLHPGEHVTVFARRLGTKIIALMFRLLYGQHISDPTSGFRIINKKALHCLAFHFPVTFNEPEAARILIEKGFHIREVPCQMKPRAYGASSITSLQAVYLMLYIIAEMIFAKVRTLP